MHQVVWKNVGKIESISQLWKELEIISFNYEGPTLPKEHWVQNYEEDEIPLEEIDEVEEEENEKEDFEESTQVDGEESYDTKSDEFEETTFEKSFEEEEKEKEEVIKSF